MTDLLAANEKLFLLNQKLIAENRKLREALAGCAITGGCFCGKNVVSRPHSTFCKLATEVLEVKK